MIVTTTANEEDAQRLAAALVERRLAACVQIDGPVESHYRWEGKLEVAAEWRLVIKTTAQVAQSAEEVLKELHPYDEPEILRLPVMGGSLSYLSWLAAETQTRSEP